MISSTRAKLALIPFSLLFAALPAFAQDTGRMHEVVSAEADSGAYMGSVLVAQGGTVLFERSYGSADLEWAIPNDAETKFRIGSVTKQFTAVSILLLAEQGKIDLDAPVSTYWPDSPPHWDKVSVRNVLRHTSGIPSVTRFDDFATLKYLPKTRDEMIARFASEELEFEPGSKFNYSNSGYLLLTAIIEEVSGENYEDFVRASILDPLGMGDTGIDKTAQILPKRADGYSPSSDGIVNADYVNMGIPRGAGAFYSTTGDLLKWQEGLWSGEIISQASLDEYVTPTEFDAFNGDKYAHGILVDEEPEGTAYWHGGGIEGFNAWVSYDPDREITVVVLSNLNGGSATKLGGQLMTVARGGSVKLPGDRQEVVLAVEALGEYVGTYRLTPDFAIVIRKEGAGLVAQATGQGANAIYNEAPDMFFLKAEDAQLHFQRDDAGQIVGLVLLQNGSEYPAMRE